MTLTRARVDGILKHGNGKEEGQKGTDSRAISELVSTELGDELV